MTRSSLLRRARPTVDDDTRSGRDPAQVASLCSSRIRSTPSPARNASGSSDRTDGDRAIGSVLLGVLLVEYTENQAYRPTSWCTPSATSKPTTRVSRLRTAYDRSGIVADRGGIPRSVAERRWRTRRPGEFVSLTRRRR